MGRRRTAARWGGAQLRRTRIGERIQNKNAHKTETVRDLSACRQLPTMSVNVQHRFPHPKPAPCPEISARNSKRAVRLNFFFRRGGFGCTHALLIGSFRIVAVPDRSSVVGQAIETPSRNRRSESRCCHRRVCGTRSGVFLEGGRMVLGGGGERKHQSRRWPHERRRLEIRPHRGHR